MHNSEENSGLVVRGEGPAYLQIVRQLRQDIANQHWHVGDNLPNEKRLAERFGVSIGTVRHAIKELEKAGLVIVMQGLGTFVNNAIVNNAIPSQPPPTPSEDSNLAQHCVNLSARPATQEEATSLNLEARDRVWHIEMHLHLGTQLLAVQHVVVAQRTWPKLSLAELQNAQGDLIGLIKNSRMLDKQNLPIPAANHSAKSANQSHALWHSEG
jgi:GntR family transcriptional regulator